MQLITRGSLSVSGWFMVLIPTCCSSPRTCLLLVLPLLTQSYPAGGWGEEWIPRRGWPSCHFGFQLLGGKDKVSFFFFACCPISTGQAQVFKSLPCLCFSFAKELFQMSHIAVVEENHTSALIWTGRMHLSHSKHHRQPKVDNRRQIEGFRIIQKRKRVGCTRVVTMEVLRRMQILIFFLPCSLTLFLFSQVLREDRVIKLSEMGGPLTMHEMMS